MNVLVMTSTFPRWHGDVVPPFVFALSRALADHGHTMHVLAPHAPGAAPYQEMDGLRVHRFRYAPTRWETLCYEGGILENLRQRRSRWTRVPPFLAAECAWLLRLVRQHSIDVVHAHWVLPQGLVSALARPWLPCPVVMSAHGADVFAARGRARRWLLSLAARRADVCTSNSTAMQAELLRLTGVESRVIPMGVDLAAFNGTRPTYGAAPAVPPNGASTRGRVLFVGRLAQKKGVKHLIDGMHHLRATVPDVHLSVVGDGPERLPLMAQAHYLGLEKCVEFVGAVPNSELPEYYRNADVFVAPSIRAEDGDTEGLGVVLLEAAASGIPIVASDIGGIPDVIRDGETGLLVPPGDSNALAYAVERLLCEPGLGATLASKARRHAEDQFSWKSVSERFDQVFRSLTATP